MAKVDVIKAQVSFTDRRRRKAIERKRVAAYCRVSTDSEDQLNSYRSQVQYYTDMVKCGFCGASLTRRSWHSGSRYNKSVWFCISSSKYGKKNCPECKAIPEEVLESAFVESFRIITDDHKDVLEEFLQRTEEELHSDATLLEIERVRKELAQLDQKMRRLLDMHLDQKIDFGTYQDKKLEITKEQQLKATELKRLQGEADVEKDLHKRIDAMRKLLTEAPVLKEFDRNVFESIVEKVIVGGYDEAGNADPSMITFVYKTGFEDKKNGDDYKHPRRNAKSKKLPSLPKDENSVLPQPSKDDAFWQKAVAAGRLPEGRYTSPIILKRFGLIKDDYLTNAGETLFGNTKPVPLKVGIFATNEKLTFLDMKIYEDNIVNLLRIAEEYILKNIRWRNEITGVEREEIPEIPVAVIREVLANSFAHAIYNGRTSHEICIHPGMITVYSPGEYASTYMPEEYIKGNIESEIRNATIAKILYLSKYIEQFGSGFKRIHSLCTDAGIKYSYENGKNGFKFVLYRPQLQSDMMNVTLDVTLNGTEMAVLAILKQKPDSSREEVADKISKTVRTVQRALDSLRDKGYIQRVGSKQTPMWEVLK